VPLAYGSCVSDTDALVADNASVPLASGSCVSDTADELGARLVASSSSACGDAKVCQCHCDATWSCRIPLERSRREQYDGVGGRALRANTHTHQLGA
jgi:hypothetical protein